MRREPAHQPKPAATAPFYRRKRNWLWGLVALGLSNGVVYSLGLSNLSIHTGFEFFMVFALNVALLGWCYMDAQERMVPITRFLGLALLAIPILGVPSYFVRSRSLIGAVKSGFGLGLFLLYLVASIPPLLLWELIAGHP